MPKPKQITARELIISEKPAAAQKIAMALAEGEPSKENYKGAPYYLVKKDGREIVVGCAVGHLFGLAEKEKTKGMQYPVFDIEWTPSFEVGKDSGFSKKYYDALKFLAKSADTITVATDYDVEGEVIGLNIVRYLCNRNDARRMKFSTLTKPDLVSAYAQASKTLDWGQAEAGETRHFLDYYYGINISRALMHAIKSAGLFKILSTGRVQGPALKIIVDKEKEIAAFKPVPFWQIELNCEAEKEEFSAWHTTGQFWSKQQADDVMKKIKGAKQAVVASTAKREFSHKAPVPFDLTTLQTEAYRCFGINPKITLDLAQGLYTGGFISYPRTSSQQLPVAIGYSRIISDLGRQEKYSALAKQLLKKKQLKPAEGSKTDPAHPAIYPTGIAPDPLEPRQAKIYDLIVKRFFSTFGEDAMRETVSAQLEVKQELFVAQGTRTIRQGWYESYAPYVKLSEVQLPKMEKGDSVKIKKSTMHSKETAPPKRYSPASLIKELEQRGLGTKSTRAEIIDTLYRRNYATGEAIAATELGIQTISVLEKYTPEIIDDAMTRHFEDDMELIRERKKKKDEVLEEAREILVKILGKFRKKEKEIGLGLIETLKKTEIAMTTVGKCPACKDGTLLIKRGKFGRFIACDKYPECKTTFKLPASGFINISKNVCKECSYPMIKIIRKGKKPQELCINLGCPTKKIDESKFKEKTCPKCKTSNLVLRRSIYGAFIACSGYPKCRYIEKIKQ